MGTQISGGSIDSAPWLTSKTVGAQSLQKVEGSNMEAKKVSLLDNSKAFVKQVELENPG
jgi:hypothetical protein